MQVEGDTPLPFSCSLVLRRKLGRVSCLAWWYQPVLTFWSLVWCLGPGTVGFFIEILRIAYSTKIKCLPEQGLTWHLSFCNDVPWQLGPPSLGGGLLQRRCLCRSPVPQWALHSDHWDQTDQPPDTATNQVKQTKTKLIIEEFWSFVVRKVDR